MPPFRPANLNKRAYPGNASIIGPTCTATIGFTTTQCCTFVSSLCGACVEAFTLGCRCATTSCPCCPCCCCCSCTICTRTVPSGRYKASEQYEARTRDAWGDTNCSTGNQIGFCGSSGTIAGSPTDCKGFYICCGPSTSKWFVAPSCTQITSNFNDTGNGVTCANSLMGSCGWFVPNINQIQDPGYSCRTYWDSYTAGNYWSSTPGGGPNACGFDMSGGTIWGSAHRGNVPCAANVRVFRCTA